MNKNIDKKELEKHLINFVDSFIGKIDIESYRKLKAGVLVYMMKV